MKTHHAEEQKGSVRRLVREGYSKIATDPASGGCGTQASCCGSAPQSADKLAREIGYSVQELQALPEGYPGQLNRHHWGFYDPAHATGTDEEKLAVFRRARDEIKMVFQAYADGRRDQMKATV